MNITGQAFINGNDAYSTYGVVFTPEAINNIKMPYSFKDRIKNESRQEHGTRYINHDLKVKERSIMIEIHLIASKSIPLNTRYNNLVALFDNETINIELGSERGVIYHFIYDSCTQFAQVGNTAKFVLKLIEPNPKNRV